MEKTRISGLNAGELRNPSGPSSRQVSQNFWILRGLSILIFLLIVGGTSVLADPASVQDLKTPELSSTEEQFRQVYAELERQRQLLHDRTRLPIDEQRSLENHLSEVRRRLKRISSQMDALQRRESLQAADIASLTASLRDFKSQMSLQNQNAATAQESIQEKTSLVLYAVWALAGGIVALGAAFLVSHHRQKRVLGEIIGHTKRLLGMGKSRLPVPEADTRASWQTPDPQINFEALYPKEISTFKPPDDWIEGLRITLTSETLQGMVEVVDRAERERPGLESGGALVGRVRCDADGNWQDVYVEGLLSAGNDVKYECAYYEEDRAAQGSELERFRALDTRVSYLGDFHRHPGRMYFPSGGDHQTDARNVCESFAKNFKGGFVYVIFTRHDGSRKGGLVQDGWRADFYFMHRGLLEYVPFQPRIVEGGVRPKAWQIPHLPRVRSELGGLRAFAQTVRLDQLAKDGDDYLVVDVADPRWGDRRVLFFLADNYPYVSPTVFLAKHEKMTALNSWIPVWSPNSGLVNILYGLTEKGELPS